MVIADRQCLRETRRRMNGSKSRNRSDTPRLLLRRPLARCGRTRPVDQLLCSHVDLNHIGDRALFTRATFLPGACTRALLEHAYPDSPQSKFPAGHFPLARSSSTARTGRRSARFRRAVRGRERVRRRRAGPHSRPRQPACPHVSVLRMVYLAGDSAHDWRVVTGETQIAHYRVPGSDVDSCAQ
ncbi:hypothetical protein FA95DRAFT_606157 [Auriscalpium vulgare]|uniref:Uncharacterized protein n=1 Tax=Auriscalpium vulgare TaxID=40419 RepID=A0ACB8RDQ5_9AGAM|nr:hypothetical protein FA95DRAFT_606157 [Auriscalpium vulgare]